MDATRAIQNSIHVFSLVHINMCPGFWVHIKDMAAAFSMYPTSIQELLAVADAGRLMPPKSTWFEPKLRSGLFIHQIEK